MKKIFWIFLCLALLIAIVGGVADANPYGYAYYRTITVDHTKVGGLNGYAAARSITIDHTKVNGYLYSRSITIDHTKVPNPDQSNFPVLIAGTFDGSGGIFDARTVANGGTIQNTSTFVGQTVPTDLIFTSDSGCANKLKWDFASYSATTGAIEAWVKVPTVSHTTNTVIYMCYDNSLITLYQGGSQGAAWDSNFKGVWHMPDGTTLSAKDSTSNANNGTLGPAGYGTPTAGTGEIQGDGSFSSAGITAISTPNINLGTSLTVSAWVNPTTFPAPRIAESNYATGFYLGGTASKFQFAIKNTFIGQATNAPLNINQSINI